MEYKEKKFKRTTTHRGSYTSPHMIPCRYVLINRFATLALLVTRTVSAFFVIFLCLQKRNRKRAENGGIHIYFPPFPKYLHFFQLCPTHKKHEHERTANGGSRGGLAFNAKPIRTLRPLILLKSTFPEDDREIHGYNFWPRSY